MPRAAPVTRATRRSGSISAKECGPSQWTRRPPDAPMPGVVALCPGRAGPDSPAQGRESRPMAVVLVGTLDTKGRELAFVRDLLVRAGLETRVIDAGSGGPPAFPPDIDR